jgi:5-methylcytosine-specific restriction endonuclease McrA
LELGGYSAGNQWIRNNSNVVIMAYIPKSNRPPWGPKKIEGKQAGRRHDNYKFYNSTRWRKVARQHKIENPTCAECERIGKFTEVKYTDHIEPIPPVGNGDPWDPNNLQSLCEHHHAVKSGQERHKKK